MSRTVLESVRLAISHKGLDVAYEGGEKVKGNESLFAGDLWRCCLRMTEFVALAADEVAE